MGEFEEIPLMKNYGPTLIGGRNETSGRQMNELLNSLVAQNKLDFAW